MLCSNCNIDMIEVIDVNPYDIRFYTDNTQHTIAPVPYVCPQCGLTQLYVKFESFLEDLKHSSTKYK